jgi:lipoate-protein ligase B
MPRPGYLLDLPRRTDYRNAHDLQCAAVAARHAGRLDRDLILLLEHTAVFTLGRRGGRHNLIVAESFLKQRGIAIEDVERGGDITFHGPGQLVAYLIMDLNRAHVAVTDFVSGLENAMIQTAAHWQIAAHGDAAYRGVWVNERKLGSVGITVRRGITFHGLALNVTTDLEPFTWINPCGLSNCTMTTLAKESTSVVEMPTAKRQLSQHLSHQFDLSLTPINLDTLQTYL